ncbi:hypothetical protein QBC40DRAFT_339624 [Triangularia verruculosa]|uniref:HD/PDEase domain-containing protein n=1 Tax=Triangularia verruculosa TaxID=2587418 RepID=A0AAN7AVK1_9PEZI|nr:hypothetical protein QBC40DRAFT_339624 [Triangularia verruculosa]
MDTLLSDPLITSVTAYVKEYMKNYDASHDFDHIQRVLSLSHHIHSQTPPSTTGIPPLDLKTIHLSALLHDVGDRKYLQPNEDPTTLIQSVLLSFGSDETLAKKVQEICNAVSYSGEVKNPSHVQSVLAKHPELAVVQDADRLDALGAMGLARMFTFGGAKRSRDLQGTVDHIEDKLVKLEFMMKTEEGKRLARVRTERLRVFQREWREEVGFIEKLGLTTEK